MPEAIIIDTDPGVDDAMAILFALKSPELEVIALTTVFGNHFVDVTTRNALRLLELAGREDIPVARGAEQPLIGSDTEPATIVHGNDALGDVGLDTPPDIQVSHARAAQFIVETIMSRPGEITLAPIGPLTNIALALKLEPRIAQATRRVVLMGGAAFVPGNMTPVAEANIYGDPEAAAIVFGADWDLTMVGLDVTMKVQMTPQYIDQVAASEAPYAKLVQKIVPRYQQFHVEEYGSAGDLHTHDPSVIAYLVNPELFTTVRKRVRVGTSGYGAGQIIVDATGKYYTGVETTICTDVNGAGLLDLYRERMMR